MQSQKETLNRSPEEKLLPDVEDSNKKFFGPALPPHLLGNDIVKDEEEETKCRQISPLHFSGEEKTEWPGAAPPDIESGIKSLIGPEIPEFLKADRSLLGADEKPKPASDEDDNFGPSTTLMAEGDFSTYKFLNARHLNTEMLQNACNTNFKRETWMIELPNKKSANYGLFPRHFKSRVQTDKESDGSVWTDTPADKKKNDSSKKIKNHVEILQMKRLKERDKEMEKLVKKAAKKLKKKQSLLEIHVEKMKKNKKIERKKRKKEGKTVPERRPFDRNVDLKIQKIDENQKRAILNRSQFLNDKFAPGQSKFL